MQKLFLATTFAFLAFASTAFAQEVEIEEEMITEDTNPIEYCRIQFGFNDSRAEQPVFVLQLRNCINDVRHAIRREAQETRYERNDEKIIERNNASFLRRFAPRTLPNPNSGEKAENHRISRRAARLQHRILRSQRRRDRESLREEIKQENN